MNHSSKIQLAEFLNGKEQNNKDDHLNITLCHSKLVNVRMAIVGHETNTAST